MDWFGKLWNWKKNADALDAARAEREEWHAEREEWHAEREEWHAEREEWRAERDESRAKFEAALSELERLRAENESSSRPSDAADEAYAKLRKRCSEDLLAAHLEGCVELVELMQRAATADLDGILDFADLEKQLKHRLTKVGNAALGALIELGDDEKKRGAEVTCPDCGATMRHDRRRERSLLSSFGHLTVRLHGWRCDNCLTGVLRPRELQLGVVNGRKATLGMRRMASIAGAEQSYEAAAFMIGELCGVQVSSKMLERATTMIGALIAADEKADGCRASARPAIAAACRATAYMAVDGTGIGMRPEETEGRAGKGPDRRARSREAKLVVGWQEQRRGQAKHVSFNGAIESAAQADATPTIDAPFWQRVAREAERIGFQQANRRVLLGDGAAWIWKMADELCPDTVQILDLFHVLHKINAVCKDRFDSPHREFRRLRAWVKRGRLDAVAAEMRALGADDVARYIENNRRRMDYPRYRREGLTHSSSRVESACKSIVGDRMKQSGMRWTKDGANAVLALRCYVKSKRLEEYFKRVQASIAERLTQCVRLREPVAA